MTTQLLRSRKGRQRALPALGAGALEVQTVVAVPKWEGHCPDLNHHLGDIQYCESVVNLIPNDGVLTVDSGFDYLLEADLPLGVDATVAEAPVLPFTDRQPIIGIFELIRQDTADDRYNLAFATSLGIDGAATGTVGALFWYDTTTPAIVEIPFGGAGTAMASSRDDLYDWVFYPYGGTPISPATEVPGIVVYTNNVDEVYQWDPGAGLGSTPPGEYDRLFNAPLGTHPFYAKSVELFDGRLVFLNTTENDGGNLEKKLRRCRWTSIGAAVPSLTAVGASFLDFDEFGDEGLRVLRFRDIAACYFRDGIGFIRRTQQATQPFIRQYVTKERGLLAPRAVCRLTEEVHFIICTDGWFLLNSSGEFQEIGLDGKGNHKWKEDFYNNLSQPNVGHIVASYDQFRHLVRVAWPRTDANEDDGTKNEVWIYDIKTDTVWPQADYQVTYWGESNILIDAGVTIDDLTGTIDDLAGTPDDYAPVFGQRAILFGDKDGYIYVMNPSEGLKLGRNVSWEYDSFRRQAGGDLFTSGTACRVDLQYESSVGAGGVTVSAINEVDEEDSRTVSMEGTPGRVRSIQVFPHLSGRRHGVRLVGEGKPRIRAFALSVLPLPAEGRTFTPT